ncbi:MAG: chromosomal replication initiator protein DnaA [Paludibacteraceae bacterium]|nr:chromosomal replication initiator protein DnaA [Paludibacteraceae bacterium]MDY6372843.1 chromosomal replication initiator protein DnaA [Bacteroidales bacterium]MDY6427374.1 chromosomal replication initiator protein DnaA [Bacteroidales bacterium]
MSAEITPQWNQCLAIIRDNIDEQAYDKWFEPIKPLKYVDNTLTIEVPSPFFPELLEQNFAKLIRYTLNKVYGESTKLMYRCTVDQENKKGGYTDVSGTNRANDTKITANSFASNLNQRYSFSTFIEGDCNKLPRTAGINIASQPGKNIFNPLFIYGKSGVGKTHLANAIGLKVLELHPQKRVLFISSSLFQLQYTEAARTNQVNDFINYYQSLDVLIVDDIQEFGEGNKKQTQNIFFQIFNHLQQTGKQLVFTCDKKPAELDGMEDRLLTRFKCGLSAEIELPDFDTRKAILKANIEKDGLKISDNVINYIAENVTGSIRDLEGTIISIVAQSTMNQRNINIELAKKVISNIVASSQKNLSVAEIRDMVCDFYGVSLESLLSESRKREIVQARQVAMYFAKIKTKDSLTTIGTTIGKRNHATVLHACKTVQDLIDTDKSFRSSIEELNRMFK